MTLDVNIKLEKTVNRPAMPVMKQMGKLLVFEILKYVNDTPD